MIIRIKEGIFIRSVALARQVSKGIIVTLKKLNLHMTIYIIYIILTYKFKLDYITLPAF